MFGPFLETLLIIFKSGEMQFCVRAFYQVWPKCICTRIIQTFLGYGPHLFGSWYVNSWPHHKCHCSAQRFRWHGGVLFSRIQYLWCHSRVSIIFSTYESFLSCKLFFQWFLILLIFVHFDIMRSRTNHNCFLPKTTCGLGPDFLEFSLEFSGIFRNYMRSWTCISFLFTDCHYLGYCTRSSFNNRCPCLQLAWCAPSSSSFACWSWFLCQSSSSIGKWQRGWASPCLSSTSCSSWFRSDLSTTFMTVP